MKPTKRARANVSGRCLTSTRFTLKHIDGVTGRRELVGGGDKGCRREVAPSPEQDSVLIMCTSVGGCLCSFHYTIRVQRDCYITIF